VATISNQTVKAANAAQSEYVIWDDNLKGFGLRVLPSGRKSFIVKYRIGRGRHAKQRKTSLGAPGSPFTTNEARVEAQRILARAKLGEAAADTLSVDPNTRRRLNDLLDRWAVESAPVDRRNGRRRKAASYEADIRRLNIHVRPTLGDVPLEEIHREHLTRLRQSIACGETARTVKTKPRGKSIAVGGDGTAVATLRILKSVFAFGVDIGWLTTAPTDGLKLPASRARERYLNGAELSRLGMALREAEAMKLHPYAITIVRLLALTGARRGEIEQLRWDQVDQTAGALILENAKSGRAAWPLSRAALGVLANIPRSNSAYVFPSANGDSCYRGLNKIWPRIREMANLTDVRLHDLRHSFASVGASKGIGLPVIGKLLGHRNAATTTRYAHIADNPLRAAADQVADVISARLDPPALKSVGATDAAE